MSQKYYTQNILSTYVLKRIFSHLELNIFYKIIKYNKYIQNRLNITWENSILKYHCQYTSKTKGEIIQNIEKMQEIPKYNYISYLSYTSKFLLKYHYHFSENIDDKDEEIKFAIKYKGFKINDYPIQSNFNYIDYKNGINLLKKYEYFFNYSLNDKNIELINLINDIREKNRINLLVYNKLENLYQFFHERKSMNENYTFMNPIGRLKNKIINKEKEIMRILLKKELRFIYILEKENTEYIFLYSNKENKIDKITNKEIKNIIKKNNNENFHLTNNTNPKIIFNKICKCRKYIENNLVKCRGNNEYGYQILNFINDTLIGVLEGPPDTPYENGYFLFKILFPDDFPFKPIKFCFITPIFHPNISEGGFVCIDVLDNQWTPAHGRFPCLIHLVQSLLDDPNPDDFINEFAAKLCKKDRNIYNETVRCHISQFANYSKFLDDLNNLNIHYEVLQKRKKKKKVIIKKNEIVKKKEMVKKLAFILFYLIIFMFC